MSTMSVSKAVVQRLQAHVSQKLENYRSWLGRYLTDETGKTDESWFPYLLDASESAKGALRPVAFAAKRTSLPAPVNNQPRYLSLIPHLPNGDANMVPTLLGRIRDEAFGKNAQQSQAQVMERIAVVIGVNQMESIDFSRNVAFQKYVKKMPDVNGIPHRVIGRLWTKWPQRPGMPQRTYSIDVAFRLLSALRVEAAKATRKAFEESESAEVQAPLQEIRGWIKNSDEAEEFFDHYFKSQPGAPLYASLLDDDTITLRAEKVGLFSIYDQLIAGFYQARRVLPQLLSTGYEVEDKEEDVLRLAVEVDMAVRTAMASVFGTAPYYPEPNLLFLLNYPLHSWSFLGNGKTLEALRLVENAENSGILQTDRTVFAARRALITQTPPRMRWSKHEKIGKLTQKKLGEGRVLDGLRGVAQVHTIPKQWGERMYRVLPITAQVTDISTPLMSLFTSFCPQNFVYAFVKATQRYHPTKFPEAFAIYPYYVQALQSALFGKTDRYVARDGLIAQFPQLIEAKQNALRAAFDAGYEKSVQALQVLHDKGLQSKDTGKCVMAAYVSGVAIAQKLWDWQQRLPAA